MELRIDPDFKNWITPLTTEEYKQLEKNIIQDGCREPLTIWKETIIDGHNRYAICTEHNLPFAVVEMNFENHQEALNWIIDNQVGRRNLAPWQLAVLRGKRYNAEKLDHGGDRKSSNQFDNLKTKDKLASQFGVSPATIQRDGEFAKAAEIAAKEVDLPVMQLTKAQILEVAKEIQQEKREARRAERIEIITTQPQPLNEIGKFNIILADPPWRYEHSVSTSREIENQYPTMSLDEICALPVQQISFDDCVLFLWATSPKLTEAIKVMEAWGFTYRTNMVWVKDKIGMGYYARQQHEILLIGAKGELPTPEPSNRPSSVIRGERTEHSAKPEEFYRIIEIMYPEFRKVELFCRTPQEGWYSWGNQS